MEWLQSLILGVVQGITEFLPISSDGHLSLFQLLWPRASQAGATHSSFDFFFDVMLHLGTATAIVVYYRQPILDGIRGFLFGASDVPPGFSRAELFRIGLLVFVATLPLVPDALFFKPWIEKAFQSLTAVGVGFLITAAVLAITTRLKGGAIGPAETTPTHALLIGIAQAFAPLPGVSRSGLTIAMALALGFQRTWAVGFSLLLAVPAILGAAVFELRKVDLDGLSGSLIAQTVVATIVAGLVGFAAITWLVRVVRGGRLWYFSVYLVVLGLVTLALAQQRGSATDAIIPSPADRGVRPEAVGAGAGRADDRLPRALDRAESPGPGAGRVGLGAPAVS